MCRATLFGTMLGHFGASPEILDFLFSSNKQACHLARSPHKIVERDLNRF